MSATRSNNLGPPVPIVALVGWLVPGAGYWLVGQRTRGLTVGVTIVTLFLFGILIAGVRVVDAPDLGDKRQIVARVLEKPSFIGQVLVGPLGLGAAGLSNWTARTPQYADIVSYGRRADIGTLYTAVAGMLNLLTIIDSTFRAARQAPVTYGSASGGPAA